MAAQEASFGITSLPLGRSFCLGPDWSCSDAVVLFDRNSGDYWVVSSLAGQTIKALQTNGSMSLDELDRQLWMLNPDVYLSTELLPTLNSLADNRLVETSSRTSD